MTRAMKPILATAFAVLFFAGAASAQELLDPDKAFKFSALRARPVHDRSVVSNRAGLLPLPQELQARIGRARGRKAGRTALSTGPHEEGPDFRRG